MEIEVLKHELGDRDSTGAWHHPSQGPVVVSGEVQWGWVGRRRLQESERPAHHQGLLTSLKT